MDFRTFSPSPALAPYVSMLWRLRGENTSLEFDTVLPDGSVELIFHRGDPFAQRVGTHCERQHAAFVVGDIRRPVSIRASTRSDVIGVRFRPGRAYPFFRMPMSELANGTTALGELWPAARWEPLSEARNPIEFIAAELQRMQSRGDDDALHACVDAIVARSGATTIKRVAMHVGVSVRQLERKFERGVGIPAKTFARVIRFHSVAARLRDGSFPGDGYSDQSHLIREFRELAGITPGEFLRRPGSLTDLFLG